jgi:hypothetical protein
MPVALAYRVMTTAEATGAVTRSQTGNGPDSGLHFRVAFKGTLLTLPAVPTGLQATASLGQVALSWTDAATNEAGFLVERCMGAGCTDFTALASVGANGTAYQDAAVAAETSYRYQVRAVNALGASNPSEAVEAVTPVQPLSFRGVGTHFPTLGQCEPGDRAGSARGDAPGGDRAGRSWSSWPPTAGPPRSGSRKRADRHGPPARMRRPTARR